ncbi:helix-turn-helix domain-containing protein [Streptomyces sirii]|uniref:helix-turn-helix domain-containing protein n=1 Tax=Streptomyces sirii TaxID=3127701 RepID=UPI003D36D675
MRTAYLDGRSIAALAREHGVSRGAVRTAVADLMPEHTAADHEDTPALGLPVTLDMPGKSPTSFTSPNWTTRSGPRSTTA